MPNFCCPVCGNILYKNKNAYTCDNGHCFDVAKQGYINLLQSQKSKLKRHGDDKLMIKARNEFLNCGYYEPLLLKLIKAVDQYLSDGADIVDAGCGDCYYSGEICNRLKNRNFNVAGVDISKDAVIFGAKRCKELSLCVGSVFSLPFQDSSADCVLNIFSPLSDNEYGRVLKKGGFLLRVIPLENHLFGLKEKIYDNQYRNVVEDLDLNGFALVENIEIKYDMEISTHIDIQNLFMMTPYYYKTSAKDQAKVNELDKLTTPVEFSLLIYKKL